MLLNLDIIAAAERYRSRAELSAERKAYIDRLAEEYERACGMSVMNANDHRPEVEACRVRWHEKAKQRSAELCLVISYCHSGSEQEECCGK